MTGNLVIGAWSVVVALPLGIVVAAVAASSRSHVTGWFVFIAVIAVLGSITWAATRVFSVALYRYATSGQAVAPFAQSDLEQPFRKRRRGR